MRRAGLLRFRPTRVARVLDLPYLTPTYPIDDVCLTDVTWKTLLDQPQFKGRVHTPVKQGEEPAYVVSGTLRCLALLPVATKYAAVWAPFLVDTGSSRTFLTQLTREAVRAGEC